MRIWSNDTAHLTCGALGTCPRERNGSCSSVLQGLVSLRGVAWLDLSLLPMTCPSLHLLLEFVELGRHDPNVKVAMQGAGEMMKALPQRCQAPPQRGAKRKRREEGGRGRKREEDGGRGMRGEQERTGEGNESGSDHKMIA